MKETLRRRLSPRILITMVFLGAILAMPALAAINLSPTRVLLTEENTTAVVNILNQSKEPQLYRVEWKNYQMMPDGRVKPIEVGAPTPEGMRFSQEHVRYSPRQVRLAGGERQLVRIALKSGLDKLEDGEYRSHLSFESIPEERPSDSAETKKQEGIQVKIKPNVAVSIPVIIQKGVPNLKVGVTDVSTQKTEKGIRVSLNLTREGNVGAFGNLLFYLDGQDPHKPVHQMRFLGVYKEVAVRPINTVIPIEALPPDYAGKTLRILYDIRENQDLVTSPSAEVKL